MRSSKDRDNLFSQAFGSSAKKELPTPNKSFRWDNTKVAKLSFTEKYSLSEFEGKHYRELPAWVLDAGLAIPSDDERKYQKKQLAETGLNQSERNEALNTRKADSEALAAMVNSKVLSGTVALDSEISFYAQRYGHTELVKMLNAIDKEAANYVSTRIALKATEEKAQKEKSEHQKQASKEIEEAKKAIEVMNKSPLAFEAAIRGSADID